MFPYSFVVFNVSKHIGCENKKATIDPTIVAGRFFLKCLDHVSRDLQRTKPRRRTGSGDRSKYLLTTMKRNQFGDVNVADSIAVCKTKVFPAGVLLNSFGVATQSWFVRRYLLALLAKVRPFGDGLQPYWI